MEQKPQARERLFAPLGPSELDDSDLVACLLGTGSSREPVQQLSAALLRNNGGVTGLLSLSAPELLRVEGLGPAKVARLLAMRELILRWLKGGVGEKPAILDHPEKVYSHFSHLVFEPQEVVACAFLTPRLLVLDSRVLFRGQPETAMVDGREVFRRALKLGAACFVLVHNHPTGDPAPSGADKHLTKLLSDQAQWIGIPLMDHVVLAAGGKYFSFAKEGLLDGSTQRGLRPSPGTSKMQTGR